MTAQKTAPAARQDKKPVRVFEFYRPENSPNRNVVKAPPVAIFLGDPGEFPQAEKEVAKMRENNLLVREYTF